MNRSLLSRREALSCAAAALPLVAAATSGAKRAVAAEESPKNARPTVGIATLGFPTYTNQQLAEELAREHIKTVQLFLAQSDSKFWKYNGRSDVSSLSPQRCQEIAGQYRFQGISIHSIGVYTNLIHPDPAEVKANLEYFEAMMRVGAAMGVRTFITEAGHHHTKDPEPPVPLHYQEETWKRMVATGRQLAELAQKHDATVLFEPFYRGFLATAKRMRLYLEEIGSPRVRALLDPANLLEHNDLEEMFQQLGPWIDCIHAKDRKLHVDRGVAVGQGDLDYVKFMTLAAEHAPKAPLILEYVGPKDYKEALSHLGTALARAAAAAKPR